MPTDLESLEVFFGELTPNRAAVYARLACGAADLSLMGIVRGPRCSRGSTLSTTYRLVEQASRLPVTGQVENLSYVKAQALITDPIFWSPDWPALYDVTVELRRGNEIVAQTKRTIGLRPLKVLDKGFDYGGKFWVLRGVRREAQLDAAIAQCREHAAALVAPAELLDERLLTHASEAGVLLVAQLPKTNTAAAELSRLSPFAAVAIAVVPPGDRPFRPAAKGNMLLAHHVKQGQAEPPPDDARLLLGEVIDAGTFGDWARSLTRTAIAHRALSQPADIATARAACDRLQRDLAPWGQYAGYIA